MRETTPQVEEKIVPEVAEDDESWTLISNCRAKPSPKMDLGVERVKGDATAQSLEGYVHARCKALSESLTIHRVKVLPLKEGQEEVCVRITVNSSDAFLLKRGGDSGQGGCIAEIDNMVTLSDGLLEIANWMQQ